MCRLQNTRHTILLRSQILDTNGGGGVKLEKLNSRSKLFETAHRPECFWWASLIDLVQVGIHVTANLNHCTHAWWAYTDAINTIAQRRIWSRAHRFGESHLFRPLCTCSMGSYSVTDCLFLIRGSNSRVPGIELPFCFFISNSLFSAKPEAPSV